MSAGPREQTTEPARDVKATIAAGIRQYLSDLHAEWTHDERMNLGALRTLSRIDEDADSIASYIVDDGLGLTEEWTHALAPGVWHSMSDAEASAKRLKLELRSRWVSGWSVVDGDPK